MATSVPVRTPGPGWYRRIRYDTRLESQALRRLETLDFTGCRSALATLVEGLDLTAAGAASRPLSQLLLDILQRLNRKLHTSPEHAERCQTNRVALIEEFADCEQPASARRRFLRALDRLLAEVERPRMQLHPQVERAKRFIDANYRSRISLSTVADALHVSPNYLSRIFRAETGVTLTAYVHRVRLEHATSLLSDGAQSISEIAYRVGYQNYRDFYRNFVKYEKTAPRAYRRHVGRSQRPAS